jgi:hypothetical protein
MWTRKPVDFCVSSHGDQIGEAWTALEIGDGPDDTIACPAWVKSLAVDRHRDVSILASGEEPGEHREHPHHEPSPVSQVHDLLPETHP